MPPSFAAPTIVWTFAAVCGPLTLLAQDPRATAGDAVSSPAVAAQIDRYLTRLVPFGYSGNVLVAQRGQIIMAKGYGFANRAQQLPFTERTVVPMGSLVKPFTMLAIPLYAQGAICQENDTEESIGRRPERPASTVV